MNPETPETETEAQWNPSRWELAGEALTVLGAFALFYLLLIIAPLFEN